SLALATRSSVSFRCCSSARCFSRARSSASALEQAWHWYLEVTSVKGKASARHSPVAVISDLFDTVLGAAHSGQSRVSNDAWQDALTVWTTCVLGPISPTLRVHVPGSANSQ